MTTTPRQLLVVGEPAACRDVEMRLDGSPIAVRAAASVSEARELGDDISVEAILLLDSQRGCDVSDLAAVWPSAPILVATSDSLEPTLAAIRERAQITQVLHDLVVSNAAPMVVLDGDGSVIFGNPSAAELFRCSADELTRMSFDVPSGRGPFELSLRRADGTRLDAELRCVSVRWNEQDVSLATLIDLSERRRAEELARSKADAEAAHDQTRHQLELILHSLPVSLWTADVALDVGFFTGPLFAEVEPFARSVRDVFTMGGDDATMLMGHTDALAEGEARFQYRYAGRLYDVIICREGDTTQPIGVIGCAIDVTAQQQLEDQFRQAQKMEAIGRLAGGIAHDFNNLLTAMLIFGNFVKDALDEGSAAYEDMKGVLDAADKAKALSTRLLAFSRRQAVDPKVLSLNEVIRDTDKILRRVVGEHIELRTQLVDEPWNVEIDPGAFEQVLMNLCVNAKDAMPDGGTLTIETQNTYVEPGFSGVQGINMEPGEYMVVAVSDTGVGMSESVKRHVFEPFFTTKPKHEGTGLGLATCYGIIKQAGGFIWAYSEVGQGTTMKIYLPRCVSDRDYSATTRMPGATGGIESILVVEDNDAIRQIIKRVLTARGYTVYAADSGAAALRLVSELRPKLDMLLTDLVMPGLTGQQLAESLNDTYPGIKVLFMSGYSAGSIPERERQILDGSYLAKPFDSTQLEAKVRDVLDSDGYTLATASPRILLVDDDRRILRAMATLLGREFRVVTVPTGPQALEVLAQQPFDLIICDVLMPDMNGPELLDILERADPRAASRTVFWTGADTHQFVRNFRDQAPRKVLSKPVRVDDVRALLVELAASP